MASRTVCAKCGVQLKCLKNGMTIHYESGVAYSGDRYGCPECGAEIALTAVERLAFAPDGREVKEQDVKMRDDQ